MNEISGVRALELIQNLCFVIIYLNGQPTNQQAQTYQNSMKCPAPDPELAPILTEINAVIHSTFFMSLSFCLKMVTVLSSMSTSN